MSHQATTLADVSRSLCQNIARLRFSAPITHVYNPLQYARETHEAYLERYGAPPREIVLVGMNPGPFGMAQTGVPFGDVSMVRDWLKINGRVGRPKVEHPKRPVLGFGCNRGEVSGTRLWGWARDRFGTPEAFFERFFVLNYCPLVFMEASGKNLTPDKLPARERVALFAACDEALRQSVGILTAEVVVGIGAFAEKRIRQALSDFRGKLGTVLHPSPASPRANRGWAEVIEKQFNALGIDLGRRYRSKI